MPENVDVKSVKDGQQEVQELASKALRIQNKRIYLDVNENKRGRFVKITEVSNGGQKSRILMSLPIALEMKDKINKLSEVNSLLPPLDKDASGQDKRIASDTIFRDSRRYYLDLKENERGRFLRLKMLSMGFRVQIVIPAHGMIELKNALSDLIQDYTDVDTDIPDLPKSKVLFVGNKTFYFDVGSNRFGVFLRISEVRANVRSSVTIPEQHCIRFRDVITELAKKMSVQETNNGLPENENGDDAPEEVAKTSDAKNTEVEETKTAS